MNDPTATLPVSPAAAATQSPPANWKSALADLVGSRAALVQLEARQALQFTLKRVVLFAAAALLLLFTWIILMAGLIGVISDKGEFPWYWVALITGGVHLLIAIILIAIAKSSSASTPFQFTREEFKKDREWLQTLQSHDKSKS